MAKKIESHGSGVGLSSRPRKSTQNPSHNSRSKDVLTCVAYIDILWRFSGRRRLLHWPPHAYWPPSPRLFRTLRPDTSCTLQRHSPDLTQRQFREIQILWRDTHSYHNMYRRPHDGNLDLEWLGPWQRAWRSLGKGNNLGMASHRLGLGAAWLCNGKQNDSYSETLGTRKAWNSIIWTEDIVFIS